MWLKINLVSFLPLNLASYQGILTFSTKCGKWCVLNSFFSVFLVFWTVMLCQYYLNIISFEFIYVVVSSSNQVTHIHCWTHTGLHMTLPISYRPHATSASHLPQVVRTSYCRTAYTTTVLQNYRWCVLNSTCWTDMLSVHIENY